MHMHSTHKYTHVVVKLKLFIFIIKKIFTNTKIMDNRFENVEVKIIDTKKVIKFLSFNF